MNEPMRSLQLLFTSETRFIRKASPRNFEDRNGGKRQRVARKCRLFFSTAWHDWENDCQNLAERDLSQPES